MTTFIDIHVLQTVPSSNLNRDDTGSPKSAIFGGIRRARVSSQAWKRATRRDFEAYLPHDDRGIRTRRIMADLVTRIVESSGGTIAREEALEMAKGVMSAAAPKIKFEKPKRRRGEDAAEESVEDLDLSQYLIFISNQQLERLAALALAARDGQLDKAAAKRALTDGNGVEVALFGRMVADDTAFNVDASVQVAHAISTHAVETEHDYFTAVDDAKGANEDAGAGMIGVLEFNSSTLYRYATVNLDQLRANLGGDVSVTGRAVAAFLRSFVVSMPTGKQNTFANGTLPDAVVVQIRDRRPVNLVGAFEAPVVPKPGVATSVQSAHELATAAAEIDRAYGVTPTATFVLAARSEVAAALAPVGEPLDLETIVSAVAREAVATLQGDA